VRNIARHLKKIHNINLDLWLKYFYIHCDTRGDKSLVQFLIRTTEVSEVYCQNRRGMKRVYPNLNLLVDSEDKHHAILVGLLKAHSDYALEMFEGKEKKMDMLLKQRRRGLHDKEQIAYYTRTIESKRLIPVSVKRITGNADVPRGGDIQAREIPTPEYVKDIYKKVEEETGDPRPFESFSGARVTGSTVVGITNALGELQRDEMFCASDFTSIARAVHLMRRIQGQLKNPIQCPKYTKEEIMNISVPVNTGSGVRMVEHEDFDFNGYKFSQSCRGKKSEVELSAKLEFIDIIKQLTDKWNRGDLTYDPEVFGIMISVLKAKCEAKGPLDDFSKNRIFYIVSLLEYLMSKYILEPVQKISQRRGLNGIGVKWWNGDSQRLWNQLKKMIEIGAWDVSRFDQSQLPDVLGLVFSSWILCFKKEDTLEYFITKQLLTFMTDQMMVKVVEWPDGNWRLSFGYLLSGHQNTSSGVTENHIVSYLDFLIHLLMNDSVPSKVKDMIFETLDAWVEAAEKTDLEEIVELEKKTHFTAIMQGDNGIMASKNKDIAEYINLTRYKQFMEEKYHMIIKWKNCDVDTTLLTEVDASGNYILYDWIDPEGVKHSKPRGIEFLKHRFLKLEIDGNDVVVPFRQTQDFWYRAGTTATVISNPLVLLFRCSGLLINSNGTNPFVYRFIEAFMVALIEMLPTISPDYSKEKLLEKKDENLYRLLVSTRKQLAMLGYGDFFGSIVGQTPTFNELFDKMLLGCTRVLQNETFFANSDKTKFKQPIVSNYYIDDVSGEVVWNE